MVLVKKQLEAERCWQKKGLKYEQGGMVAGPLICLRWSSKERGRELVNACTARVLACMSTRRLHIFWPAMAFLFMVENLVNVHGLIMRME